MILRKLRSRAGASLIAALFLFLLCAMAGSTILAAATANAGRISQRREENQAYYKTISAARLFAEGFEGKSVTITWKRTVVDGSPDAYSDWNVTASDSDKFSEFLKDSIEEIYGASPDTTTLGNYWSGDFSATQETSVVRGFDVTLQNAAGEEIPGTDVYGRIALQSQYGKIRAIFSSKPIEPIDPTDSDSLYEINNKAYLVRLDCELPAPSSTITDTDLLEWEYDLVDTTRATKKIQMKTITFTWPDDIKIKEG